MIHETEDRKIFASLMSMAFKDNWAGMPVNDLAVRIGKYFLNTPYGRSTLDNGDGEKLVINLRQMDCFTFVENVIALTRIIRDRSMNFETFGSMLLKLRYRSGIIDGYASRLHYYSDWFYDNQLKGFLFDVTKDLGGQQGKKTINYMTKHPELYPPLKNSDLLKQMKQVEQDLMKRAVYRIRKTDLSVDVPIKNGDVIAITTSQQGLDVAHTALAVFNAEKFHLLHASKEAGKVVISQKTIYEYLDEKKERTGIIVGRIL